MTKPEGLKANYIGSMDFHEVKYVEVKGWVKKSLDDGEKYRTKRIILYTDKGYFDIDVFGPIK